MHIGIPLSCLVNEHFFAFCTVHRIRFFCILEPTVNPPPAIAARLDSAPIPLPERKPAAPNAPARADWPFKGIALILASTVFLGLSDVTAKYLTSSLPSIEITWIRFMVFALIMTPAMVPGSPFFALKTQRTQAAFDARRHGARLIAVLHHGSRLPADRGSLRHRFCRAAVRHRVGDRSSSTRVVGLRRWIATAVGLLGSSSSCGPVPARSIWPRSFRWSRRLPGRAR